MLLSLSGSTEHFVVNMFHGIRSMVGLDGHDTSPLLLVDGVEMLLRATRGGAAIVLITKFVVEWKRLFGFGGGNGGGG